MEQIHGTCVEIGGVGVLLRGAPGSGKTDLALRLIEAGARLVADDRVNLMVEEGELIASAPAVLAGLLEVRGIGIVPVRHVAQGKVGVIIDLVESMTVERLPEPACVTVAGVEIPLYRLDPFEASAPAKVRLAVRLHGLGKML